MDPTATSANPLLILIWGSSMVLASGLDQGGDPSAAIEWSALRAQVDSSRYTRFRGVFDRLAATLLLLFAMPVLIAIAVAIRMDSGRPILFRQARVGRHGQPFTIVKFRTMSPQAPVTSLKIANDDPYVTRSGRLLRRTGLDELPNLWNVVRGDMALIGPRPEQLGLLHLYEPWQHARHLVKPGITGWWQIHHRDTEPMHLHVDKDLFYVQHQSFALDLKITLATMQLMLPGLRRLWRRT